MGLVSKIFAWITHPLIDEQGSIKNWVAGLVVVLILAFMWTTVLREIE